MKIALSIAGFLILASTAAASGVPALNASHEDAVARYAKRYIAHPDGKNILKGILWVESKNGKYKRGDGSYGIAQFEISTARYVARNYGFSIPETDKGVKEMLMLDDEASIKLAAAYLGMLERRLGSLGRAVVAYNLGPTKLKRMSGEGEVVPLAYLRKVMARASIHKREEQLARVELSRKIASKPESPKTHLKIASVNGDSFYAERSLRALMCAEPVLAPKFEAAPETAVFAYPTRTDMATPSISHPQTRLTIYRNRSMEYAKSPVWHHRVPATVPRGA